MKLWFKNKQFDERVTTIQNKIYRELYLIIVIICGLSVVYKVSFEGSTGGSIMTEILILIISGIFYLIRSSMLGIFTDEVDMYERKSKWKVNTRNLVLSLLAGLAISLTFAFVNSQKYADTREETIYFFLSIFAGSMMIYLPFLIGVFVLPYALAKYKSDRVNERELEDMEEDDEQDVR
ncbi:DUF6773 family protein [Alkalihalobacillus sp. R86527]|uniref:DUF6773 family protein n=1 Tax=Alkalihalobacillus sp. R86527 TaxID=3093863 RepID=UPI003671C42B